MKMKTKAILGLLVFIFTLSISAYASPKVLEEIDMEKIIKMSLDMAETVEFYIRKQTKKPKTTRRNKKKV